MKRKKLFIGIYLAVSVTLFAGILIISAMHDLDISRSLSLLKPNEYFSSNAFCRVVEVVGEIPVYFFVCYALAVVFWNAFYFAGAKIKYPVCAAALIFIAFSAVLMPYRIHAGLVELNAEIIEGKFAVAFFEVSVGLCMGSGALVAVLFTGKKRIRNQFSFAVAVLFVAGISIAFSQGLKMIDRRVRFRAINLMGEGGGSFFTPWYKFNGRSAFSDIAARLGKDAIKSLPSGHTASAGITFTLLALPYVFGSGRGGKLLMYLISFGYTLTVAFARLLMGAHFLSDVAIGIAAAFFPAIFIIWLIFIKKAVKPLNVYCGI